MKILLKKIIKRLIKSSINEIILTDSVLTKNIKDFGTVRSASNLFNNLDGNVSGKAKIYPPFLVSKSSIGAYTYIAPNSTISFTTIGKFCSIGPNLICGWGIHPTNGLSTAPMFYSTMKQNGMTLSSLDKIEERKQTRIGNDVFIGMNVTILDGVTIGDGAIIGAGAVISKDIPPYAIAVGNPIKIIKYRFSDYQIEQLLKIKWWNFEESRLKEIEEDFFEIDRFIEKNINK